MQFIRPQAKELTRRLKEPRRFIQAISGARQVGKTSLALQVAERSNLPRHFASADEPTLRAGDGWITSQWEEARYLADGAEKKGALLILDEVQKVPQWSETVKGLWDEDSRRKRPVKVLLLGSAPLLIGRGLAESLAGRFETLHLPHWSFPEMHAAFGWNLEQYLFYGAYPGAAALVKQPARWARYIKDSLIETTTATQAGHSATANGQFYMQMPAAVWFLSRLIRCYAIPDGKHRKCHKIAYIHLHLLKNPIL